MVQKPQAILATEVAVPMKVCAGATLRLNSDPMLERGCAARSISSPSRREVIRPLDQEPQAISHLLQSASSAGAIEAGLKQGPHLVRLNANVLAQARNVASQQRQVGRCRNRRHHARIE